MSRNAIRAEYNEANAAYMRAVETKHAGKVGAARYARAKARLRAAYAAYKTL